ncbi:MAG: hypothetical protein ABDI20_08225 [Candidatus Bipolaricaulaceae bacterium]
MDRAKVDLLIIQGEDFQPTFQWLAGNQPVDLTGWRAEMHIRRTYEGPVLVELTTENGRVIIHDQSKEKGYYTLRIDNQTTASLFERPRPFKGVYDLFLIRPDGVRQLHQYGAVSFLPAVTRRI